LLYYYDDSLVPRSTFAHSHLSSGLLKMEAKDQLHLESPKGNKTAFWAHFGFEIDETLKRVDDKIVHCRICQRTFWTFFSSSINRFINQCFLCDNSFQKLN